MDSKEYEFLVCKTETEDVSVRAIVKNDTICLSQKAMAELFDCSADNMTLYLKNIHEIGELDKSSTAEDFSVVQRKGNRDVKRNIVFYNRIRSIRASERRIWQQIADIYAECSVDYDKDSETTKRFYSLVQNKFHYAITG